MVETRVFCAISDLPTRAFAKIGVVEVQKLEVFCDSCGAGMNPLRGSAWSRCKNSRFFAIFDLPARPSAIGVVEVQKLEVFFCDF